MAHIKCYLVNSRVQRVQNMYGKGTSYGRPKLALFSSFVATKMSRCESKTLRQFSSAHLEMIPCFYKKSMFLYIASSVFYLIALLLATMLIRWRLKLEIGGKRAGRKKEGGFVH